MTDTPPQTTIAATTALVTTEAGSGHVIAIRQDDDVVLIPCLHAAIGRRAARAIMRWVRKAGGVERDVRR